MPCPPVLGLSPLGQGVAAGRAPARGEPGPGRAAAARDLRRGPGRLRLPPPRCRRNPAHPRYPARRSRAGPGPARRGAGQAHRAGFERRGGRVARRRGRGDWGPPGPGSESAPGPASPPMGRTGAVMVWSESVTRPAAAGDGLRSDSDVLRARRPARRRQWQPWRDVHSCCGPKRPPAHVVAAAATRR